MYQENFYSFISSYLLSEIEVGTHLYWEVLGLKVHGQTILMSWFVISILLKKTNYYDVNIRFSLSSVRESTTNG